MLLISACLLGAKVKYNGSSNYCTLLAKYKDCGLFIPICPECLGQLTIPVSYTHLTLPTNSLV